MSHTSEKRREDFTGPDPRTERAELGPRYKDPEYLKAQHLVNGLCNEHDNLKRFFDMKVPELITEASAGNSCFSVLGVGSGPGVIDLHILSLIQKLRPDLKIHSESIEPSQEETELYKANLSTIPALSDVTFAWHNKTTEEYQKDAEKNNSLKKFDLIHMIQMLYYVKSVKGTLEFFKSCLSPEGRLVILVLSGDSGWNKMYKKYKWLLETDSTLDLNSEDIVEILDAISLKYEIYDVDSTIDVTECFVEGSKVGEMLLKVITEQPWFETAALTIHKQQILEHLQSPEHSARKDGRIFFDSRLKAIIARH